MNLPFKCGEKRTINIDNYIIPNPYLYKDTTFKSKSVYTQSKLFIFIPVRPCNYEARKVIRKTWIKEFRKNLINYKFFMGKDKNDYHIIEKENRFFKDIIQFNFTNHFYNLTILTLLSIEWIYKYVYNFEYVMKCDEDMIPNLDIIKQIITYFPNSDKAFLVGYKGMKEKVIRNKKLKTYIPYNMYNHTFLPEYVYGGFMFYSHRAIEIIHSDNISIKPIVYKEDVYIGLIASKYNMKLIDIKRYYSIRRIEYDCRLYKKIACIHGYSPSEIEKFWNLCKNYV